MVGGHAQHIALLQVVKFEHHAIDFVSVRSTLLGPDGGCVVHQHRRLGGCRGLMNLPWCRNDAQFVFHPDQHRGVVVHVRDGFAVRVTVVTQRNLCIVGLKHKIRRIGLSICVLLTEGARCEVSWVW
ncbi:MAG: hypothetical protein CMA86_07235 [Euryarchaeota archaeon]|nr:hypothetical protein [Euryarchaeota archaeon]